MKKKITFKLPAEGVAGATEGLLLGDFNDWNPEAGFVMSRQADGSLQAIVPLETGKTYQYRFLLNDGRWENDFHAQQYVYADGFFVDNCLITVPEEVKKIKKVAPGKGAGGKKVKPQSGKAAKAKALPSKGNGARPKARKAKPDNE